MVMVFYQFEPIWVSLDTRSGQGKVKKGQMLTFLILKNKDMLLMQNVPRNPMVSFIFSLWVKTPKSHGLLNDVTIRCWCRNVVKDI